MQNAQGALATAQAQLALYTIRSPLSGQVTALAASVGEILDTTKPLATIMKLDPLWLQIAIPSSSAPQVHSGQAITFRVDALPNQIFHSQIQDLGTQIDPATNTLTALAVIPNPGGRFKNKMTARVWIVIERHTNTLLAPRSAVLFDASGKASVVLVGSDAIAHVREVQTGLADGNRVEILHGIPAGARLAASGAYGLPDGTKVTVARGDTSSTAETP